MINGEKGFGFDIRFKAKEDELKSNQDAATLSTESDRQSIDQGLLSLQDLVLAPKVSNATTVRWKGKAQREKDARNPGSPANLPEKVKKGRWRRREEDNLRKKKEKEKIDEARARGEREGERKRGK